MTEKVSSDRITPKPVPKEMFSTGRFGKAGKAEKKGVIQSKITQEDKGKSEPDSFVPNEVETEAQAEPENEA